MFTMIFMIHYNFKTAIGGPYSPCMLSTLANQ